MSPNQTNNKPHQVGYESGHRTGTHEYCLVRGTEEDRISDANLKNLTIKDCFIGVDLDDNGNIIFPF